MAARYEYTKNIEGNYLNRKAKVNNRAVHYTNKQIAMAESMLKDGLTSRDVSNATDVNCNAILNKKTTKCFKQYTLPEPYRKQLKNCMYDRNNEAKDTHWVFDTVGWKSGHVDYWVYYSKDPNPYEFHNFYI